MYVMGVDLGTTFTAAATWRERHAEIASLGSRAAAIPSVVFLREDETFTTGEAASRRGVTEPHRVAREFKRRLGDTTPILLGGVPCSAEALTARLLRSVVDEVAAREGGAPDKICLCHPANWGPYKIDLLTQVVRLSGLDQPVMFASEPHAAAVFYAQQQRIEPGAVVAVYDLGGGTFDAAVLRKTSTGFDILGQPEGIERLGGIDFDAAVFGHVAKALGSKLTDLDDEDPAVIAAVARLRDECVQAKETLSTDTDASIPVLLPNVSTEVRITRAELETMIRPALHDTVEALKRALRSAGVTEQAHSVLLVGGASRMPIVAQLVGAELGRPVAVDAHPKHAVALGAAWIASGTTTEAPAPARVTGRATPTPAPPPPAVTPPPPVTPPPRVAPMPAPVAPPTVPISLPAPAIGSAALNRYPEPAAPLPPVASATPGGAPAWPGFRAPDADNPPDSGQGRRRPTLLLTSAAVVLVLALGVAAFLLTYHPDSSGNQGRQLNAGVKSSGGSTSATPSAAASTSPTTNPPASTAPPPPPVTYPDSASAYANAAVTAWSTGNTTRLGQLNDPGNSVFDTLNAGDYDKHFSVYQCSNADPSSTCVLFNKVGDELDLHVRNVLIGHAHAVVDGEWNPITFPTDLQAYAKEALDDWGKHNTAAVALLTGKPNDSAFDSVPAGHRGDTWTFDHSEGATGHLYYLFRNPAGDTVIIGFANPGSVTPPANRHGLVQSVIFQPAP